ncbi:hypothetical protein AVEN_265630-1 [Araneus ventricosus]|uniref:Uncharacterized protein n=1 Tax=Araneus ventricosus TaxID=182803 RepID=A0A4Y2GG69_ARAVE|nr:hypothetical protein AVEN_265630-1 [Araneus ventricosus]
MLCLSETELKTDIWARWAKRRCHRRQISVNTSLISRARGVVPLFYAEERADLPSDPSSLLHPTFLRRRKELAVDEVSAPSRRSRSRPEMPNLPGNAVKIVQVVNQIYRGKKQVLVG